MEDREYTYVIQPREVDRDDIEQEAAIFEWQTGRRANRGLIAKNLANQEPAAVFTGDPTAVSSLLPVGLSIPDQKVIEKLVEWSLEQSEAIRSVMLDFLDEPTEESLAQTLKVLVDRGIVKAAEPIAKPAKVGFIDALIRLFQSERRPYTAQELYAWARSIHAAKRPEATVRQALRRLISLGTVTKTGDNTYLYIEEA